MALRGGSRFAVSMADVFPQGCVLIPGSITEAQDYDEKTGRRSPARDKVTGQAVWQCRVIDRDETLNGRSPELVIKVLTDRMPVPPPGPDFAPVEFDGLQVTPYVTDKGRMAYSLRCTGLRPARPHASKDAA
jgi:hypothetical protein